MTGPYPERRRRERLDRTDHRRAIEARRADRRGPPPRAVAEALEQVADHDVPGTPPVSALSVLAEVAATEWTTDTREVRDFSITSGDPQHGAHRSDDHVGRYEVELPVAEVADDAADGDRCPECGHDRARFHYSAHHYIAGSESVVCPRCEHEYHSERWG